MLSKEMVEWCDRLSKEAEEAEEKEAQNQALRGVCAELCAALQNCKEGLVWADKALHNVSFTPQSDTKSDEIVQADAALAKAKEVLGEPVEVNNNG